MIQIKIELSIPDRRDHIGATFLTIIIKLQQLIISVRDPNDAKLRGTTDEGTAIFRRRNQ